jgi:hypothetical protein
MALHAAVVGREHGAQPYVMCMFFLSKQLVHLGQEEWRHCEPEPYIYMQMKASASARMGRILATNVPH